MTVGRGCEAKQAILPGYTTRLRRELARPRPGSTRPRSFFGSETGSWTRRSRACNPLVKDQHPSLASAVGSTNTEPAGVADHVASPTSTRWRARCSGFLFRCRALPASLWRSRVPRRPALRRRTPREPHADCPNTPRDRCTRATRTKEHLPSVTSVRGRRRRRFCAFATVPFTANPGSPWPWLGAVASLRPRPQRSSCAGHRSPTSAIDTNPEHTHR
jgi:hypothetical protein